MCVCMYYILNSLPVFTEQWMRGECVLCIASAMVIIVDNCRNGCLAAVFLLVPLLILLLLALRLLLMVLLPPPPMLPNESRFRFVGGPFYLRPIFDDVICLPYSYILNAITAAVNSLPYPLSLQ